MNRPLGTAGATPVGVRVDTSRLPLTSYKLVDRMECLQQVSRAFHDPNCHILSIVATGGTGKTALVNHWLEDIKNDPKQQWGGAEDVFVWSFYNQGTATDRYSSSDQFFFEAFRFLVGIDPGSIYPRDKGLRLANALRQRRTLLVLDGLEPLQEPPGPSARTGCLNDEGVRSLLLGLSTGHRGLCVVTTRLPVADLERIHDVNHVQVKLEQLQPRDGADLLRHLLTLPHATPKQAAMVKATRRSDLERISREFGGHALALCLLGNYLAVCGGGDLRRRNEIRLLSEKRDGRFARSIMFAYERWFNDRAELDILSMLSLFDRPAEASAIAALRSPPVIAGLTEQLHIIEPGGWDEALANLRMVGLLWEDPDGRLDCHPLVREYFGEQLRRVHLSAWQEGNKRLYDHFRKTSKKYPSTLRELEPLFQAVAHGCQAGCHTEALHEVYFARIQRGEERFSVYIMGAFASGLTALAGFFEVLWTRTVGTLVAADRIKVLCEAAWDFWCIGPADRAVAPYESALSISTSIDDWEAACDVAHCLSGVHRSVGHVPEALKLARQALVFSRRTKNLSLRDNAARALAGILFCAGQFQRSERCFLAAEVMQRVGEPQHQLLYGTYGAEYCELLLTLGRYLEARSRAARLLTYRVNPHRTIYAALYHMIIAQSHCREAVATGSTDSGKAAEHLKCSLSILRECNDEEFLGSGLLAATEWHRVMGSIADAQEYHEEASIIAARGNYMLLEVECYIEAAFLELAQHPQGTTGARADAAFAVQSSAYQHYEKARSLIAQTGYRRRQPELEQLQRRFHQ